MGDKRQRFRAIKNGHWRLFPFAPTGNLARHLNTLTYLISGIVGSKHVHLRLVAAQVPDATKNESRIKKLSRWIVN